MDDIFTVPGTNAYVSEMPDRFRLTHASVQLAREIDKNEFIPFHGAQLSKNEEGLVERTVCKIPTWTGWYVNVNSTVPFSPTRNLI